jgi:hypothetical protein
MNVSEPVIEKLQAQLRERPHSQDMSLLPFSNLLPFEFHLVGFTMVKEQVHVIHPRGSFRFCSDLGVRGRNFPFRI